MSQDRRSPRIRAEELSEQGRALWHQGNPAAALICFTEADRLIAGKQDVPLRLRLDIGANRALCLAQTGDYGAADARYAKLARLCADEQAPCTTVLRQWAKVKEETGQFDQARALYARVPPGADDPDEDHLTWHHAMGILNWRQGRLAEARADFAAAVKALPKDPQNALGRLAVLGNDALLSWELGDDWRATRLAEQMQDIRRSAEKTTLSDEIILLRVAAMRARRAGDTTGEVAQWQAGRAMLLEHAPNDIARRLDLTGELIEALQRNGAQQAAIALLQAEVADLAAIAGDFAWMARFLLARQQIAAADPGALDEARQNLCLVMAAYLGLTPPEAEVELIIELARLADAGGQGDAAILFGKMALNGLAALAHGHDGVQLRAILTAGKHIADSVVARLIDKGRFSEAEALSRLEDRVRFRALLRRDRAIASDPPAPVPLLPHEIRATNAWAASRETLRDSRNNGDTGAARTIARQMLDRVLAATAPPPAKPAPQAPLAPAPGVVRLRFTMGASQGFATCVDAAGEVTRALACDRATVNRLIAELRTQTDTADAWQDPARRLNDALIAPFAAQLDGATRLEIDAAGPYAYVPFCLLHDGARCLVETVQICNAAPDLPPPSGDRPGKGLVHLAALPDGPLARRPDWMQTPPGRFAPLHAALGPQMTRARWITALQDRPRYLSVAAHLDCEPARPDLWALELGDGQSLHLSDLGSRAFCFAGIDLAAFATCGSGIAGDDHGQGKSLARLALEKGAGASIGTLWDISDSAAHWLITAFWLALEADPQADPVRALSTLQARLAETARRPMAVPPATGGIGGAPGLLRPADWAAFAVFTRPSHNRSQPPDQHKDGPSC
ncbi:CHAT domain-containing protein [Tropicibacter oceani]|uniref:CHAT domain-containing protein n=1 Tax=Tropicibacter oceani TaxID=3058420 RepID=A0ABY8QGR2_9RHOB|nr:CHAT domain-containing protein [Tropicibacter oceani]WGW03628.1 CHAT domain-containing protein [Tropicibacter oceani]